MSETDRRPGWERLWRHSYRLGFRWLLRGWRNGWKGARVGLARLLIPLDPWRYYEMGKIADEPFSGVNLDLSSPKLLASLLRAEGKGEWVATDLFRWEVEQWRWVDPSLRLEVEDGRTLSYGDATFDGAICVSVIEHVAGEGDITVMAELFRVLKPGGVLHLTTNVSPVSREIWRDERVWGEASDVVGGRVFLERHYSPEDLAGRLLRDPWRPESQEWASEIDPSVQDRFYRGVPWSYLRGGLLSRRCPENYRRSPEPSILRDDRPGVVYVRLRKPA